MRNSQVLILTLFLLGLAADSSYAQSECIDGVADNQYSCKNVDLLAHIERIELASLLPGQEIVRHNDIWGWTDSLSGREFVLACRENGVAFIEISDPSNPEYLGDLPFHIDGRASRWRDIKTFKNYAYIVADGAGDHGVQIFDLSQLLNITDPPVLLEETAHYYGLASAHNIVINEAKETAYASGVSSGQQTCGGALHVMNLSDPLNPTFSGCVQVAGTGIFGSGYTHDAQCVEYQGPDLDHNSASICILFSETSISIVNVDNPIDPRVISIIEYPQAQYAHQGWLSHDHKTLFADDELDEIRLGLTKTRTLIFDLTDLDNPDLIMEHEGRLATIDHNQYVRGGFLYQSNYTSGLTIWNVSDPSSPQLEGFFDTFPMDNDVNFNGSWSNYPFFPSGTIAVNDRDTGLFLLSTPTIEHSAPNSSLLVQDPYPNPARDIVNLRLVSSEAQLGELSIFNMMGQEVYRTKLQLFEGNSHSYRVPVTGFAKGAYILSIRTQDGQVDSKVIVQ